MQRRRSMMLLASAVIGGRGVLEASSDRTCSDHTTWVAKALKRILTIKPCMTRRTLLTVFTTEGGLSTGLQRTYVSRDCPYFKVNVTFQAVGRPERDANGRMTLIEGSDDTILTISGPYLQFPIMD